MLIPYDPNRLSPMIPTCFPPLTWFPIWSQHADPKRHIAFLCCWDSAHGLSFSNFCCETCHCFWFAALLKLYARSAKQNIHQLMMYTSKKQLHACTSMEHNSINTPYTINAMHSAKTICNFLALQIDGCCHEKTCKAVCNFTHRHLQTKDENTIKATQMTQLQLCCMVGTKMMREYSCNCCSNKKRLHLLSNKLYETKWACQCIQGSIGGAGAHVAGLQFVTVPLCNCFAPIGRPFPILQLTAPSRCTLLLCFSNLDAFFCKWMQFPHQQLLWRWLAWLAWLFGHLESVQIESFFHWLLTRPLAKLLMLSCQYEIIFFQLSILVFFFLAPCFPTIGLSNCCGVAFHGFCELLLQTLDLDLHGPVVLCTCFLRSPKTSNGSTWTLQIRLHTLHNLATSKED